MSSTGPDDEEQQPPQWQQPQWKSGDPLDQSPQEDRPPWQQDTPAWQQPQEQPSWQQPQEQPMWQESQPQWGPEQWQATPQTPGSATAALILGICAVVLCPLSFILAPLALVFGYKSKREIRESNGRFGGQGIATAGVILGWIGVVWVVLWVLWVVLVVIGAATS